MTKEMQEHKGEIGSALGRQLEREFGRGFSEKSLRHMIRFAEAFPDPKIVSALLRQLSWTHFATLIYIAEPLKRDFYAQMCRIEGWSTRTLQQKVGSMLYERTALSRKPAKLARMELKKLHDEDKLTPDLVFRDPYLLDFLGLKDTYSEKDLEAAILRELDGGFVKKQTKIPLENVQRRILLIRSEKVMVDADLAELYGVTTRRLNEQVRRNSARFPVDFMFQLTPPEKEHVVANCDHLI